MLTHRQAPAPLKVHHMQVEELSNGLREHLHDNRKKTPKSKGRIKYMMEYRTY